MSIPALNWAFALGDLSPASKLVLQTSEETLRIHCPTRRRDGADRRPCHEH